MRIITLLSDFGLSDGYVAQMKGVILAAYSGANIVDVTHEINRHDVLMGSFILETTTPYFPKNTIHVAVVDPGVGSNRAAILIECETGILIGPDNGLLTRASERLGRKSIFKIERKGFQRKPVSNTFHGRDIFAYTAALIATGMKPNEVGPRTSNLVKLNLAEPVLEGKKLTCQVLHVDSFGNVITNADQMLLRDHHDQIGDHIEIKSRNSSVRAKYVNSYHEVNQGSLALLMGSQGFLEIAVSEGSAADKLQIKPLDELEILF